MKKHKSKRIGNKVYHYKQETISKLGVYDFEGPLLGILSFLSDLHESHAESHIDMNIDITDVGGWDDSVYEITVYGWRLETDKERDKRLSKAAGARRARELAKKKKADAERQEYERLKKKYG